MHTLRKQLLKIQRAAYKKNLRRIEETLSPDPIVEQYSREYNRHLRRYKALSSKAELIRRVLASDVVYHGDYHTLNQSQRAVLRILREIAGKRQIFLCLEMFHADDQRFIDQYMQKGLPQKELLKKIQYKRKWGFNWENWKPVIDLCKKYDIAIIGINSDQQKMKNSLKSRDIYSAKIIGKLIIRNPDALVYVVDGDYHISPDHVPHQVEKRLKEFDITTKRTIVYQNAPNLYWQLAQENKEEANVLQIARDSFCIMNTTPANRLQSYLNWLEYSRDAYYPVPGDWQEANEDSGNTSIPAILKTICKILDIPYPEDALDRLEIYYGGNLDFMTILSGSSVLSPMLPSIRQKIKNEEAFLLEYDKKKGEDGYLIYLPNSSLNMAAEEAVHFLNIVMRGSYCQKLRPFDSFYCTVMTEAIGFFGSKLINEKRKVQTRNSIRKYLGSFKQKAPSPQERKKVRLCHLILQHRYIQDISHNPQDFKAKFREIYRARTKLHRDLATQLGYMLGDKLFYAVKKRRLSLHEMVDLFKEPFSLPFTAFISYINLSTKVARRKIKQPRE